MQIENSGTAPAEAVHLRLAADNNAEISPPTVLLETVAVGERKSLLIEITPHRAGPVTFTCQAIARGGFQSQFSEKLWIREPRLALRWQLPERVFLGSEVPARLSVANHGDAACEDPLVRVPLPATVELVDIPQQTEWAEASRRTALEAGHPCHPRPSDPSGCDFDPASWARWLGRPALPVVRGRPRPPELWKWKASPA